MIYFARVGQDGPIKIGKTVHLPKRLREHASLWRYGDALTVVGVMDGDRETEKRIHERFAHLRVNARKQPEPPEPAEPSMAILVCTANPIEDGCNIHLRVLGVKGTMAHTMLDRVAIALSERLPAPPQAEPKRGAS